MLFNAFDENRDNEITFQEFKDAVSKFSKEESKNDEFLNLVFQQVSIIVLRRKSPENRLNLFSRQSNLRMLCLT